MTDAIQDLVLPDPSEATRGRAFPVAPAALAQDVQKPSAFIDKGSVVAFTADVAGQNREDVLNSTLLAQLAADKANNRESDVMGWYATYSGVLAKLGWVSQGFNWQKYTAQKMSFTMDEAVLEIAEAALTGQSTGSSPPRTTRRRSSRSRTGGCSFSTTRPARPPRATSRSASAPRPTDRWR
jgi:hypothetical protein